MRFWLACLFSLAAALPVAALEFRSASKSGVVLYESPASNAKKLFVVSEGYPVEVVIAQGEWLKLRDAAGALAWGNQQDWVTKRTFVVIKDGVSLYTKPDTTATVVVTLAKSVWLKQSEPATTEKVAGWIKVQHKNGATGWVKLTDLWGY